MADSTEMDAVEAASYAGKEGVIKVQEGDILMPVIVGAVRYRFGRWDGHVKPLPGAGHGSAWVELHNITLDEEPV